MARTEMAEDLAMPNRKSKILNSKSPRSAFTLMELLIVITIIAIIAGLALSGLASAVNDARVARTRAQISKIDTLIMERWEGYRTRAVPIRIPPGLSPRIAAQMRIHALRDLMRMELPDRRTDVINGPCDYDPRLDAMNNPIQNRMTSPSLRNSYLRLVNRQAGSLAGWTEPSQGAECLYLILATMKDGDKSALEFFTPDEIGDVDGDGMKEILDGFGRPIEFLRWAPGYTIEQPGPDLEWGVANTDDNGNMVDDEFAEFLLAGDDFTFNLTTQSRNRDASPDPFDPLKLDVTSFGLKPLIFSSGLDRKFDIFSDLIPAEGPFHSYSPGTNDDWPLPCVRFVNTLPLCGTPMDRDNDGTLDYVDNLTNHYIEPQ
jgi:prepilin-type N-terminal cleavage/methylation domain-containing protein